MHESKTDKSSEKDEIMKVVPERVLPILDLESSLLPNRGLKRQRVNKSILADKSVLERCEVDKILSKTKRNRINLRRRRERQLVLLDLEENNDVTCFFDESAKKDSESKRRRLKRSRKDCFPNIEVSGSILMVSSSEVSCDSSSSIHSVSSN